jgi:hypothetical protein
MPAPALTAVTYIDPWGPTPPATFQAGLVVQASRSGAPAGSVLAAQILQGSTQVGVAVGSTPTSVRVIPIAPLSATIPYFMQAQWVAAGTQPNTINWSDSSSIVSAPVITSGADIINGSFQGQQLVVHWSLFAGGTPPTGGVVQIFDDQANAASTFVFGPGVSGSTTFSPTAGHTYTAYIQGLLPISPATVGGFSQPFSTGPLSGPIQVPAFGPAISSVTYDGTTLSASWTAVAMSSLPVATIEYILCILSENSVVATFLAGPNGGRAAIDLPKTGTNLQVAGRVCFDRLAGPLGPAQSIISLTPQISAVTSSSSPTQGNTRISVTLEAIAVPSGGQLQVQLVIDGVPGSPQVATGSPPTVIFDQAISTTSTVKAQAYVSSTGSMGPVSTPETAIITAPANVIATYDGLNLTVVWDTMQSSSVTNYEITVSGNGVVAVLNTGPEAFLQTVINLDLTTAPKVTVQAFGRKTAGLISPATTITLPAVTAPAINGMVYDGTNLTLAWNSAVLPYLTGYIVALSGGVTATYQTGPETSLTIPLAPSAAATTTAAVTGVSAMRNTAASTAVAVITTVPTITTVSVSGATVTMAWTAPAAPASATFMAQLLDGDTVVATASGTSTGATLTLPSPASASYAVRAHVESGVGRGPGSAVVAVLQTEPTLTFAAIQDAVLSVQWAPVCCVGVAGYLVTVAAGTGTPFSVGSSGTEIAIELPSSDLAGGSVTVAAVGVNTTSPAVSHNIVEAYHVASGSYDGTTLRVTLSGSPSPAPALVWIDVVSNGIVLARTSIAGAPGPDTPVALALTPATPAVVRATGVGAGTITPAGTATAIPTSRPKGVSAKYDGTNMHVAWEAVPDPGITGYLVSIASSQATPVYVTDVLETSIAVSLSLPFAKTVAVLVQAAVQISGSNLLTGPAGTAVPELAGYLRSISAPASSQPPYLYRIGDYESLAGVSTGNIVAYLANPFAGPGTPTVPPGTGQIFQLSPSPQGSTLPYQLVIDKSVWTSFGADSVRASLRQTYRSFLTTVEQTGVMPWAIRLVRQIIAEAMPQTFDETLYYRYGVWRDTTLRLLDLEPGLQLKISGAFYQLIRGGSQDPLNGFIAGGGETYSIAEAVPDGFGGTLPAGPARTLTVDAFLSLLFPGGTGATTNIAAGSIDFFQSGNRQTYYRLFYPSSFPDSSSVGSSQITSNIAVIGAATWQILESVTDQYAQTGFFPPSGNYFSAYFRGRTMLSPLIAVTVGGAPRWIPLGTTLRQILCALGLGVWTGSAGGETAELLRPVSSLFDEPFGGKTLRFEPVDLSDAAVAALNPPLWPLDLPLLGGDTISVPGFSSVSG